MDQFKGADGWFKTIEDELGQIGTIKELILDRANNFSMGSMRRVDDNGIGQIEEVEQPTRGSISFTISIPERIQQKFNPYSVAAGRKYEIGTEFQVDTRYLFHGPVTFVECVNAPPGTLASSAVALVREYLRSELQKLGGTVELLVVGPSPFHADFRIKTMPGAKPEEFDPINIQKARGFDICTFTFHQEAGIPLEILKRISQSIISDEFSLYYELVRDREIRSDQLQGIAIDLDILVDMHQTRGIKGVFRRLFRSSHKAREIILDILTAEAAEANAKRSNTQQLKELKEQPGRLIYQDKLQDQIDTSFITELRALKESASMLESGRTKEFEVAVLSLATLLGAASGAVASLIAK
ncbi:hypothetical protein NQK81_24635 [Amycolatopsis roodepoortensis]|uniref:hypothetical protein n=1 Tax=Amycolatopsis roodepoortensis TaxID=700274 RepID=UPI00214C3FCE|nr:hypothetical protein [Amycolatopsis roodepoortensis]UUV28010.1 hypothetical protein NQK81_24635 [Amycolatopsis roodepoortensis]